MIQNNVEIRHSGKKCRIRHNGYYLNDDYKYAEIRHSGKNMLNTHNNS